MADEKPIVVGLLGATGSGKSTFLVAAHSSAQDASARVAVEAVDARQHALLMRSWDLLHTRRIFPENTAEPVRYSFWLRIAAQRSIKICVQDHRGGVLEETNTPCQAGLLVDHLGRSDVLVLVLDGAVLGRWRAGDGGTSSTEVMTRLKTGMLSNLLLSTAEDRRSQGLPWPRVTVMVTKADEYERLTGGVVLDRMVENLRALLPLAFDAATVTQVCAVGVAGGQSKVRGHLAPFAFAAIERLATERSESWKDANRVTNMPPAQRRSSDDIEARHLQNRLAEARFHADLLAEELDPWPVFRGTAQVPVRMLAGGRNPLLRSR